MSKQTINIGASPNDGTGTPLRTSFDYTNQNFTELYTALGGGVGLPGATTQVIFNDGGTNLAGDAGLVYNKTTDALTVAGLVTAGSATITGDLTAARLIVTGGTIPANGLWLPTTNTLEFAANSLAQYRIAPLGVFSWFDGAGGTRMTLNSTGLGLGGVPSGVNRFAVFNGANQALTLDTSGNLLIGTATNTGLSRIYTEVGGNGHVVKQTSAGGYCFGADAFSNGGTYYLTYFNAGGTAVGSITSNGTGVTYGTLSDYRLKEAVQPLVGGLARVSALKPSIYKWKSNGSNGEGFLAHELADVVPSAVIGSKDEVNEDGSIKAQGVDLSKVVPILVAAIQELTARVQTLEAR